MIEAIVAATLMVVVALGVLRGLDSAQRSSGREKARSAASALTEQDQERLRSFRAVDLANYDETREVTVNKVKYVITSQVDWVRDSTGGTESCSSNTVQADYMRITSVTKSSLINTPIPPIKMSSIVAPPIGAFGANQGTLAIQVNDRNGAGVPGVPVTITAASGGATVQNPTNAVGCAIFAYVPVGSYTASVNTAGWVDRAGNPDADVGATVVQGKVTLAAMTYDRAASVTATFDTEARDGTTPLITPALSTQLSATNAAVPASPGLSFAKLRYFDPPPVGGMLPTITATGLFPFTDGYGVFGGGCLGADPKLNDSDYYTQYPGAYVSVAPAQASAPVVIRMPSINLRVLYNSNPLPAAQYLTTRILVKSTGTGCTEEFDFPAPAVELTGTGYMANSALPFGTYTVCVQSRTPANPTGSLRWKAQTLVKNWYHKGMKPPDVASPVIDLGSGTSSSTPSACS